MKKILFAAFAATILWITLASIGCSKRPYYSSPFGQFTLCQAREQYAQLFQMKRSEYERFLIFENGWWKADVKKMKKMGISIPKLCERYCRTPNLKVPFPLLVDYELLCKSG